ncbi:MAG: hypothetical protein CTY15_06835 [Methylocystis sp.]|nr:MAG: hypothetical protein CTY15_06835 [Methylocystis sp.]
MSHRLGGIVIGNFDVRRLVASDPHKEEAARLLAEAFEHSPLFEFAFPARARRAALNALFEAIVDDAVRYGYAEAAFTDEVVGIFLWYPPGRYPMPLWRELRGLPSYLRMALFAPRGLLKLYRIQRSLDRLRPKQPHCHAYFLAGRGSARITAILGRRMLAEADARSWPAYLETQSARTVTLYQRLGFEIQRSCFAEVRGAPPTWTMWRSPNPAE